jgi:hypothetical protein
VGCIGWSTRITGETRNYGNMVLIDALGYILSAYMHWYPHRYVGYSGQGMLSPILYADVGDKQWFCCLLPKDGPCTVHRTIVLSRFAFPFALQLAGTPCVSWILCFLSWISNSYSAVNWYEFVSLCCGMKYTCQFKQFDLIIYVSIKKIGSLSAMGEPAHSVNSV